MSGWSEENWKTRERLWLADKHCYWCGRATVLVSVVDGLIANPLMATREHLYSRYYYRKRTWNPPKVLACYECNDMRAKFEGGVRHFLQIEKFNDSLYTKINKAFKEWAIKQYER